MNTPEALGRLHSCFPVFGAHKHGCSHARGHKEDGVLGYIRPLRRREVGARRAGVFGRIAASGKISNVMIFVHFSCITNHSGALDVMVFVGTGYSRSRSSRASSPAMCLSMWESSTNTLAGLALPTACGKDIVETELRLLCTVRHTATISTCGANIFDWSCWKPRHSTYFWVPASPYVLMSSRCGLHAFPYAGPAEDTAALR
jgi:hypothetical protein